MTKGVVRVGQTVRRPAGAHSTFVRRLLEHLETIGFSGAPRALGTDDAGRDILSYIEGDVPEDLREYDDSTLVAAARLIRRFHDATEPFLSAVGAAEDQFEVVCHNDLSPCNFVFRDGVPTAIIDFDAAAPGLRVHDVGYAAWLWLDIGNADLGAARQRQRLQLFVESYSEALDRRAVVEAIEMRQTMLIAEAQATGRTEMEHWAAGCRNWTRLHL